jgi:hypothetical protein
LRAHRRLAGDTRAQKSAAIGSKADGSVYVDRQQCDATGKSQILEAEEVSAKI